MTNKSEYGKLLTNLIKNKNISQSQFYQDLKIKKPYFYDIISGKVNPPPMDKQIEIINYLDLKQEDIINLIDVAAMEREELPLDIVLYMKSDKNRNMIRKMDDYSEIIGGKIKCQKN